MLCFNGPEFDEQIIPILDTFFDRSINKREVVYIVQFQGDHLQNDLCQVRPQDLRESKNRASVIIVL